LVFKGTKLPVFQYVLTGDLFLDVKNFGALSVN